MWSGVYSFENNQNISLIKPLMQVVQNSVVRGVSCAVKHGDIFYLGSWNDHRIAKAQYLNKEI